MAAKDETHGVESAAPSAVPPGARWKERYEPLEMIGEGSQGQVYRAIDHQHDRVVALKVRAVGSDDERAALLSEARILLGLRPHAGVPLVRDDFFVDERYVIVMDWIEGINLGVVLEQRGDPGLATATVVAYLAQVAAALDHLHSHQPPIVHGDVKPANCVLTPEGRVVLVDFGISSWGGERTVGSGTRGYLAPEVAAGDLPTPAADIFGLAATTFALLDGATPGPGGSSHPLAVAVRRGLAIDPARRPASAGELVDRLRSRHEGNLPLGVVTFMLTDIEGSTAMWDAQPAAMADALTRHETIIADVVEHHRGRLIKSAGEGDATLSVFVRATDGVLAALELQRVLGAEPWPSDLDVRARVALHTGEAQLREGDYFGTTVNRAARVRGLAVGGQVLLSAATHQVVADQLPTDVSLNDLGRHELRGLSRDEQVFGLVHPDLDTIGAPPLPALLSFDTTAKFVGREAEQAALLAAWRAAAEGARRVVLVGGEPGIGKSTLVAHAARAAYADGATVLVGRCDERLGVPYQPFVEALTHVARHSRPKLADLGPLAGELVRLVPELVQRVPDLPPPVNAESETERYRLFEAVAGWLAAAPAVLVIEDVHWAAKPTLLMLRHLIRSSEPTRLLLVVTYRDTEVSDELGELLADLRREVGAEYIGLQGLSEGDVAEMSGDFVTTATLFEATAGNPLFVSELVRHRAESGDTTTPPSVRDVLRRRMTRLPAATADVLTTAALIGPEFDAGLVADARGISEVEALDALDVAMRARLLKTRGTRWAFVHDLVRSAAIDDLSRASRAGLHRTIAEALETVHGADDHLAELAHHWCEAAALGEVSRAVGYAGRAGDEARAALAMEDAAAWYERALGALDLDRDADEGLRCDIEIAVGDALKWAGDERHRPVLMTAVARARALGDEVRIGHAALALSPPTGFGVGLGTVDAVLVSVVEDALAALAETPATDALRARLLVALTAQLVHDPDPGPRQKLCRQAIEIARRAGDVEALRDVLHSQQLGNHEPDNLEERVAFAAELVAIGHQHGDADATVRGLVWQYETLFETGDIAAADAALAEAEQSALDLRPPLYGWLVGYHRAGQAWMAGRLDEAERLVNESVLVGEAAGYGMTAAATAVIVTSGVRWDQGRDAEVIAPMAGLAELTAMPIFALAQAWAEANTGRRRESRATLDALDAAGHEVFPRDWMWLLCTVVKGMTAAQLEDSTRAASLYSELLPYANRNVFASLVAWGPVSFCLGLLARSLGRWDDAEQHFRASVDMCERMGSPTWLARTRCEWAVLLSTRGEPDRARELATEALATAEELGMAGVAAKARSLLRVPLPRLLTRAEQFAFVGRVDERGTLDAAWAAASDGERRVVLIAGEPGAGKTRLASEFARAAHEDGALVLGGRCDEGMGVPYQPFVEALRWHVDHTPDEELAAALGRWPGELTRLVPEIADRLPDATPTISADPETERYRLFEAVASWLDTSPIVLVLDDLQWATAPTLLLLRHVVRAAATANLLIVGTYRDTELSPDIAALVSDLGREGGVACVDLAGLAPADVTTLAEASGVDAVDIHSTTGGNPFFVAELLRQRAESDDMTVPSTVRSAVDSRVRRLPEAARRVLEVGALIGEEFDRHLLLAAAGGERADTLLALDAATAAGLVAETRGQYRFAHALVREGVASAMGPALRSGAHLGIAEAIEAVHHAALEAHVAALAHHFGQAGERDKACDYATRAGHAALQQQATDDAVRWFDAALEVVGDDTERCELLIWLAEARRRAGDLGYRDVVNQAAQVADALGDSERLARATLLLVEMSIDFTTDELGARLLERALELLDDTDSDLRARSLAGLGIKLLLVPGARARRTQLSDDALAMARRLGDLGTLGRVLFLRFATIWFPDTLAERLANAEESHAIARQSDDPYLGAVAAVNSIYAHFQTGDLDAVDRSIEDLEGLAPRLGLKWIEWILLLFHATRLYGTGRLEEAEAMAESSFAAGQAAGKADAMAFYGSLISQIRAAQGRMGEILPVIQAMATTDFDGLMVAGLATAYVRSNQDDEAKVLLTPRAATGFADLPDDPSWLSTAALWSDVATDLHDIPGATALYELIRPYAEQHICIVPGDWGPATRHLGELASTLGEWDEAEACFADARERCDRMNSISGPLVRYQWAEMLVRRGQVVDRPQALELARQGLAIALTMDAQLYIDQGEALVRELSA